MTRYETTVVLLIFLTLWDTVDSYFLILNRNGYSPYSVEDDSSSSILWNRRLGYIKLTFVFWDILATLFFTVLPMVLFVLAGMRLTDILPSLGQTTTDYKNLTGRDSYFLTNSVINLLSAAIIIEVWIH
jgi:hypothetical protein